MSKLTRYFLLTEVYEPTKKLNSGDGTSNGIRHSLSLDFPFANWRVKELRDTEIINWIKSYKHGGGRKKGVRNI